MSSTRFRLGAILGINQTLSWGMTFYLPAIIARPVATSLHLSEFMVLGAFSWATLVAGICAPSVGKWIDEHGGRGSLLTSILVMAAGLAMLAISHGIVTWYLGWTVIGLGMAMGLYDAAFATVGGLLGQDAGPAITGITLVAGFASSVFWTLGATLIGTLAWRGLLGAYVGLMLIVNLPMVWMLVPPAAPPASRPHGRIGQAEAAGGRESRLSPRQKRQMALLGAFFSLRWFITSMIAVHALSLLHGIGLTPDRAVAVAALIGPSQVAGRLTEYFLGPRVGLMTKARIAALLFPLGALLLLLGGPWAAMAFAVLYGMSNGIMTINRGTLPLALFGAEGYARMLGWLAVPVLLAQATAPTLSAPLVTALPALDVLLLCGAGAAVALLFLLPLRLPSS